MPLVRSRPSRPVPSGLAMLLLVSLLVSASPAQVLWSQTSSPAKPQAFFGHAMAYDSDRGRVVLFGGQSSTSPIGETWEWDGTRWHRMSPRSSPSRRSFMGMAYDAARRRTVLFGGRFSTHPISVQFFGDTWEWDGTDWTQAAEVGPTRSNHRLAYDAGRQRIVLFGGTSNRSLVPLGDTWEWDGTAWQQATVAGPPARLDAGLAYDPVRQVTMLFGGTGGMTRFGDTWEWNGSTWRERAPAVAPSPRTGPAMAYDPPRERVVLFGGWDGSVFGPASAETWEWTGSRWLARQPVGSPPPSMDATMVADAARGSLVLYGGRNGLVYGSHNETWEYAPAVRGVATPVGAGCGGPQIAGVGAPVLGNLGFSVHVTAAPPAAVVFLALSAAAAPFPFGPCTIYPQVPFAALIGAVADQSGTAVVPKPIHFVPAWSGFALHHQGFVLQPGGPLLGFASVTPGLRVVIGS